MSLPCTSCGQSKNGSRHSPRTGDHAYEAPEKPRPARKRMGLSEKPHRVERRRAGSEEAARHHARVTSCEAPQHGITTPCRGRLQHSHRIGKGMGGGKDYALEGECDILCEQHHAEVDTRRAEMRAAGLSRPRPLPEKVHRLKSRYEG